MQPTLQDWLARKPKGPAPKRPLKRTQRVKRQSVRRQREGRIYSQKRKAFLEAKRVCYAGSMLEHLEIPNVCTIRAEDVHHRAGRTNGNYLNDATWLPVCRSCHDWIHAHPADARAIGLLM